MNIGASVIAASLALGPVAAQDHDISAGFLLSPACGGRLLPEVVVPAVVNGLRCLGELGDLGRQHADDIQRRLNPRNPIRIACDDKDHGAQATYAPPDGISLIEIGGRMRREIRDGLDQPRHQAVFFHEMIHLLRYEYAHHYIRAVPDMAVACEICCHASRTEDTSYLDRDRMTRADLERQCRACGERSFDVSLDYRRNMLRLAGRKVKVYAFNLLEALSEEGMTDRASLEHWLAPDLEDRICPPLQSQPWVLERGEEGGKDSGLRLAPSVRDYVASRCLPRP